MKNWILLAMLCFVTAPAFADYGHVTNDEALTIILGAAGDEDYPQMYAIACALRNRDNTDVQEMSADISNIDEPTRALARQAWVKAHEGPDVANGATMWVNRVNNGNQIRPDGSYSFRPDGFRNSSHREMVAKVGRHEFYK